MDATTTRDVARRAGVAIGTVFAHFPDRAALVESVLEAHIAEALRRTSASVDRAAPVIDQVMWTVEGLWAAYDAEPALSREVLRATLFFPSAGSALGRQLEAFQLEIVGLLDGAVRSGELPPQDFAISFLGFFGLYFSLLLAGLRGDLPPEARGPLLRALLARLWKFQPDVIWESP